MCSRRTARYQHFLQSNMSRKICSRYGYLENIVQKISCCSAQTYLNWGVTGDLYNVFSMANFGEQVIDGGWFVFFFTNAGLYSRLGVTVCAIDGLVCGKNHQ